MKRITALLISLALIIGAASFLTSCSGREKDQPEATESTSAPEPVSIPTSPVTEKASLEEACEAAGIESITIPKGITPTGYGVVSGAIVQVNFDGGFLRKGFQSGDISEDYNVYTRANVKKVGDYSVTMKGNDGKIMLAVWADMNLTYSYCISISDGVSESVMRYYIINLV